jgi:hypothetical protein
MNRNDSHQRRSRRWRSCALVLLLPACFRTRYLQDDAAVGQDDAAVDLDDAAVDLDAASGLDAFSYAQCPASYDVALPGPSRYRLLTVAARGWEHSDTCAQDLSGATHLVILETSAEVASIQALVDHPPATIAANGVWVGGVQLKTATVPDESWLGFDGRPLINDSWYDISGDHEPNDSNANEADHLEQFVSIVAGKSGLNDSDGSNARGALCECDGHPVAVSAAAAVAGYRMP